MQYYTYELSDGTNDVGPYHCYNNYNYVAIQRNIDTDYQITLARMKASARGATPVDVQVVVGLLEHDDLMKYERSS